MASRLAILIGCFTGLAGSVILVFLFDELTEYRYEKWTFRLVYVIAVIGIAIGAFTTDALL